jgi:hypothetical protein
VELSGVPDEQAALTMVSAATVVRKKRLDVMRSSSFGFSTVGVGHGTDSP